jgi:hypothetical protein
LQRRYAKDRYENLTDQELYRKIVEAQVSEQ